MKFNSTQEDKIVISYSDLSRETRSPRGWHTTSIVSSLVALGTGPTPELLSALTRWDFRYGGLKTPKGFAPMYVYDTRTGELDSLVAIPAPLPEALSENFAQIVVAWAAETVSSHGPRPISEEEIKAAVAFAKELVGSNGHAVYFTASSETQASVLRALFMAKVRTEVLGINTTPAQAEKAIRDFNSPEAATVLIATDKYATGWAVRNPETVVVFLDANSSEATLIQRAARVQSVGRITPAKLYAINHDVEEHIARVLFAKAELIRSL